MEEPPPQDDDPNFSTLNPMRSPLLSRDLIFEGLFFKNWGWASQPPLLPIQMARYSVWAPGLAKEHLQNVGGKDPKTQSNLDFFRQCF